MPDINATQGRAFTNGGSILLNTNAILNIVDASAWNFDQALPVPIEDSRYNNGVGQAPLAGNVAPGRFSLRAKFTTLSGSSELANEAAAVGTGGRQKLHTIVIRWPDTRGSATGQTLTMSNVTIERLSITPGAFNGLDEIAIEGTFPAAATYGTF